MASEKNLRSIFSDIAKAIRRKKGNTNKITPINFSDEIDSIESGVFPQGKITLIDTSEYDVTQYATAQIVDEKLKPENIAKDITILGVTGTMQSGSDITANIKVTNSISDIMVTEHNKLCILNDTSGLGYKVVDKIEGGSEEISALSEVLTKRLGFSCCSSYEDDIYIFGGRNSEAYSVNIYKFNCTTKNIETLNIQSPQALSLACCSIFGDNIYTFGGYNGTNGYSNTICKFNCTDKTMIKLSTTLPRSLEGACCSIYNNNIYIFGGNGYNHSNTIYKFNCTTETIVALSVTLPNTLSKACCISYGDDIYIFGGYYSNAGNNLNTIYKFNCTTETISTLSTTLPQAINSACCSINDGNIYIFGGIKGSTALNTIYKFNCTTETISTLSTTLPQALYGSCCSIYGDNIYIFGGYNGTNDYLNTIYNFAVTFDLTANNVLIYNANSNYSFDLITDQVTIPIKKVYIGDSNNTAQLANAYLYDESQSGWVNVNTGEVLS